MLRFAEPLLPHALPSAQPTELKRLAAAAEGHWKQMGREDASAADLRGLLSLVCPAVTSRDDQRPLPLPAAPADASGDLGTDLATARKTGPSSRCFRVKQAAAKGAAPAVFVSMHAGSANEPAALLAHAIWAVRPPAVTSDRPSCNCTHARAQSHPPLS